MAPQYLQKKVRILAWHLGLSPINPHQVFHLAWSYARRESIETHLSISVKAPLRTNSFPFLREYFLDHARPRCPLSFIRHHNSHVPHTSTLRSVLFKNKH